MIEKLIRICATNKFVTLTIVGALVFIGMWSMKQIALDALPDLSDTQVIIYSRWDRSPDIIEDQVTYPIITSLLGAPKVKTIRGFSDFGFSYVYVIFEEGTDLYWARSRTLEYLSKIQPRLPEGVQTELGPDATGVGWVFQYALVDKSGKHSLADLRSLQDWTIRYALQSVPGVAEVASLGGFVRQYQITVDPNRLSSYGIPLMKVDGGGPRLEQRGGRAAGRMERGRVHGPRPRLRQERRRPGGDRRQDRRAGHAGQAQDVASVQLGPEIRRGVAELDGEGEVAAGVVVMRHGENAMKVIDSVKASSPRCRRRCPKASRSSRPTTARSSSSAPSRRSSTSSSSR